jgi:hypothetical protein
VNPGGKITVAQTTDQERNRHGQGFIVKDRTS